MTCRHYSFALMLMAVPGLSAGAVTSSELTVPTVHWQEGMATGVVTFGGTLYVQRPGWVWSDISGTDMGLVPAPSSTGLAYSLPTGSSLPVLGGYTETLLPPEPLTIRPSVSLNPSTTVSGSEAEVYRQAAEVRGFTADGRIWRGEMTFRVRYILACQDRGMAVSRQGWRLLSDSGAAPGLPVLSSSLTREINSLFLSVAGYDYPLMPSDIPQPPSSTVMACQTFTLLSPSQMPVPDINGEGIAGASLVVLEDVQFRFPENGEVITGWQAGIVPEVTYR